MIWLLSRLKVSPSWGTCSSIPLPSSCHKLRLFSLVGSPAFVPWPRIYTGRRGGQGGFRFTHLPPLSPSPLALFFSSEKRIGIMAAFRSPWKLSSKLGGPPELLWTSPLFLRNGYSLIGGFAWTYHNSCLHVFGTCRASLCSGKL